MSCSIKFVRLDDFIADVDVLDLSANGYSLAQDGYFPTAAPLGAKSVREVITLKLQGTSKDDLAAMTQEIDEKIKQVEWWLNDPIIERYQVWIRVQLDNESLPRQAQIISIMPPDKVRVFTPEEQINNFIGEYQIGIERTPFWEDPYPYPTTTGKTNVSLLGGIATLSETINGDVPARIAEIVFKPEVVSGELYFGWRSSRMGDQTKFHPVWNVKDATTYNPSDTTQADATAYSGTKFIANIDSTMKLHAVVIVSVGAGSSDYLEQRGSYNVLVRAKMSDSSTAYLRQGYGYLNTTHANAAIDNITYRSMRVISGTSWKLYPLGSVVIPPDRNTYFWNAGIQLEAKLISGSGALDLDCLILIPALEGFASLTYINTAAGDDYTIRLRERPDGSLYAYVYHDAFTQTIGSAAITHDRWSLPANSDHPILVIAGQSSSGSVKTDETSVSYTYIPRWRTLRGNST